MGGAPSGFGVGGGRGGASSGSRVEDGWDLQWMQGWGGVGPPVDLRSGWEGWGLQGI